MESQQGRSIHEVFRGNGVIRTPDRRLRVFVSSTMGELAEEREAVTRAISALRLTPVLFELGARPHPPRALYRAYLAQSDVFIGLYWQSYGQIDPDSAISGLEDEFHLSATLPRLVYVKVPAPDREPRLVELLARIRNEASYRKFTTPAELDRLVREDLATLLSERFAASADPPATAAPSSRRLRPLPADTTSLVGREQAIEELVGLLCRAEVRLVTLTGPGGIGKTRLALAVGQRLRDRFEAGTVFVPLAAVTRPELVLGDIARAVGAELGGTSTPLEALAEQLADEPSLLILDNLEQVIEVAGDLGELLARCRGVQILATSRRALGLQAEQEYPVAPLPLPADPAGMSVDTLASWPSVTLFVDRARAVRHDFSLTQANAATVVELCRRLEGMPLAIELAAARTRLLDPDELLRRLCRSLDALGTGAVDLPERQRTLRATVEWSVGLLEDAERSLLETVAVFVDGWTVDAGARVAGVDEDRALALTEALARNSLIYLDRTEIGPRLRMLETIRAFVAERLAARPDATEIGRRHADYYRVLGEQADVRLRGIGHGECLERLQAEAGNLAAAVGWYLAHDRRPLPHLFRILCLFWLLRDHIGEARAWVQQLMTTVDSLDPQVRAELLWTALALANEMGDDAASRSAYEHLAPLVPRIDDPFLHAVSKLTIAWTSPVLGDLDDALQASLGSLNELQERDEPFWTAIAVMTTCLVETAMRRYDDAVRHGHEVRDLARRFDYPWLAAWSQVQLSALAVMRGQLDEARALIDEALNLTLETHNTRCMTLCLAGFAQLASAEGDPERAVLLAGKADCLRRRFGLRVWPLQRQAEFDLMAQIRQALGDDRFDHGFAAGARLSQSEAVAVMRDRGTAN